MYLGLRHNKSYQVRRVMDPFLPLEYHQKAQNAKSSLLDTLRVDSQWRGYSHHAFLPEKFLLFANGTLTIWWFSGGPIFRVAHPAYIG